MSDFPNTAIAISQAVREKQVTPQEVAAQFLDQIRVSNPTINALISFDEPKSFVADGPLAGVPVLIKDLICVSGTKTTAGSKMLEGFTAPYDATLVARLKAAGAVVLGKCNLDEFAMGSSNETSHFGVCKNPWNTDYVPGGSSGGSAAAVASGMGPLSIGTDTGGSIRQPASFCGVVGLKPTYGRVSRYGVIAYASSLDQAGPMATTVSDCALAAQVICGWDQMDATSSQQKVPNWLDNIQPDISGRRVGVVKQALEGLQPEVAQAFNEQVESFKSGGAEIVELEIPNLDEGIATYYLIAMSEASSNLSRFDGVRYGHRADFGDKPPKNLEEFYSKNREEGFGEEVKRRILLGTFALSSGYYEAYFQKAAKVRALIRQQIEDGFSRCDVIATPVSSTLPFRIGEKIDDPIAMFNNDRLTILANLAGIPAMSVPQKLSAAGLPIGCQLMAKAFDEQSLFDFGRHVELNRAEIPSVVS